MVLLNDKTLQMRASAGFIRAIDDWRRSQADLPSRAEAIRRLIEAGLKAEGGAGRKKAGLKGQQ